MVAKKKTIKKIPRTISSVAIAKAMTSEMTIDTKILVVVLLLLFLYPVGVIFMWVWMKSWATWIKISITLPFIFGILFITVGFQTLDIRK